MSGRTWACERDAHDPEGPFVATLLEDDQPVASGRAATEMDAFARLADALADGGASDERVLGLKDLLREWSAMRRGR